VAAGRAATALDLDDGWRRQRNGVGKSIRKRRKKFVWHGPMIADCDRRHIT
jgi:hypothetical protein